MVTNYNQKKRCHNLQRKRNQPIVDIDKQNYEIFYID